MKSKRTASIITGSNGIQLSVNGKLGYKNPDRSQAHGRLDTIDLTPKEALRLGLLLIDAARMTAGGMMKLVK